MRGFFRGGESEDEYGDVAGGGGQDGDDRLDWGELFPTLQYSYGPAPWHNGDWLDCPLKVVDMYIAMLPRLQARRSLDEAAIASIPYLEKQDREKLMNNWRHASEGNFEGVGPRQLRNAADVRAWFRTAGYRI